MDMLELLGDVDALTEKIVQSSLNDDEKRWMLGVFTQAAMLFNEAAEDNARRESRMVFERIRLRGLPAPRTIRRRR